MKPVPHYHPGDVEACLDQLCGRVTTTERNAAVLSGALVGGLIGATATRHWAGALVGAIVGGAVGDALSARDSGRPAA